MNISVCLQNNRKEIYIRDELREKVGGDLLIKQAVCGRRTGYLVLGNGELYSFGEGTQG